MSVPDTHISTVTVLGAGVLGSQIAFQTAYHGHDVVVYDIDDDAVAAGSERLDALVTSYREYFTTVAEKSGDGGADPAERASQARGRLTLTTDLAEAVGGADLVIEAVPEVLDIKKDVLGRAGEAAPERTILATNSSTLLPSDLADATGRPERFLALHFANEVWRFNTAEIMGTDRTDPAVTEAVVAFAEDIGMVPIPLAKEKAGYVLNSLLVPFLNAALELASGGYAEPADVDSTWRIATGAPLGPFQIYDVIGLRTPYNILSQGDADSRRAAEWLKTEYLDKGRTGRESGRGFYEYQD
jgi:3-hydroxyacyl-CoA dehydrogenase